MTGRILVMADEVQFKVDGPCPCGSGKLLRNCCQRGGKLAPKQHLPPHRATKSGEARKGCYAACLNDCAGPLSREHYISESLLRRLEKDGLTVEGFPWQPPGEKQSLSVNALAARVLCKRHNEDLSALDAVIEKFVDTLERVGVEFKSGRIDPWAWLMNGHDLERWLLKVLCGMVAGKAARRQGERLLVGVPELWVRILFGTYVFPATCGLYVDVRRGDQMKATANTFQFAPLTLDEQAAGLLATLSGFEMALLIPPVGSDRHLSPYDGQSLYRPTGITFKHGGSKKGLYFGWDETSSGLGVTLDWSPPGT